MNISRVFIERPIATSVLFFSILFFGALGFRGLPVNDLPNVDFPTIAVTAQLPGAGPETMANSVALPLEREFSRIAGVDEMTSSSTMGNLRITLTFNLDKSIDSAALDVQSAISTAQRFLPSEMPTPPTLRKLNPADAPVLILSLTSSDQVRMSKLDAFADRSIAARFSTVTGVAQVQIFGTQKYAVKLYIDPNKLAAQGLGIDKVVSAVQGSNSNIPSGSLLGQARNFTIKSNGKMQEAREFNPVIVASRDGVPVRLNDIGHAEDAVQNEFIRSWYNDERALILAVYRQPGTNTVEMVNKLKDLLPEIKESLPPGATLSVLIDRSEFINDSINDVNLTLVLSIVLVIGVILIFLRNLRATLVTALVLPASVLGTFAVMKMIGYSLNNLSLMAITLAVGFVVDDAIVVLENITRHMEMGKDRVSASLEGAKEIGATVMTMTISLSAVFLPILFMPGMVGRLFREFAMTVGISVLISGIVSLTITPVMCSIFLRNEHQHGRLFNMSEWVFDSCRNAYITSLKWTLNIRASILIGSVVVLLFTGWLFTVVQKGFIPRMDTGVINGSIKAREGIPFNELVQYQQQLSSIIQKNPSVDAVMSSAGQGNGGDIGGNVGRFIIRLKPREFRTDTADDIIKQIRVATRDIRAVQLFLSNPPAIRIGGTLSNSDYLYLMTGTNLKMLYGPGEVMKSRLAGLSILEDVSSNLELRNPEIQVRVFRDRAANYGITQQQIEQALFNSFGGRLISTIFGETDQYPVTIENERKNQTDINSMGSIFISSPVLGTVVPLSSVAEIISGVGPVSVAHVGQLPGVVLSFNLAPGISVGDAVEVIASLGKEVVPPGITGSFTGSAKAFQEAFGALPILLLITIILIYMILAILYEHYGHPLTILTALPFAGFGAVLTLIIFKQELNIFSFVGIILLIGLVKKNGIMMVDFALQMQREKSMSPVDAIVESCSVRFRPIMMTTGAAIFATLPIAMGLGAGAETRQPLGIAVVGGLVFSQVLTLYVTPVFFVSMESLSTFIKTRLKKKVDGGVAHQVA